VLNEVKWRTSAPAKLRKMTLVKDSRGVPSVQSAAALIYRLATQLQNPPLHAKGIRIKGARIEGQLDLESARLMVPISLEKCWIGERVGLKDAWAIAISFTGSYVADGIYGDGLAVEHDLVFDNGFSAEGAVRLPGAVVGGRLDCRGGRFENPRGDALLADRVGIKGSVFLNDGFSAKGVVRLLLANIGGQLACRGGKFENERGDALFA
jgi:hypothetical protein